MSSSQSNTESVAPSVNGGREPIVNQVPPLVRVERVSTELSGSDTSMMGEADFSEVFLEMRHQEIQQQYGLYPVIATMDQVLPQSPVATAALVDGMELWQFGSISCNSCGGSASAALQAECQLMRIFL